MDASTLEQLAIDTPICTSSRDCEVLVPVPCALCSAVLPVLCALRVRVLLVGHAGGSEEEVERLGEVASRPELSSTEQPLREREYCTTWRVKR